MIKKKKPLPENYSIVISNRMMPKVIYQEVIHELFVDQTRLDISKTQPMILRHFIIDPTIETLINVSNRKWVANKYPNLQFRGLGEINDP